MTAASPVSPTRRLRQSPVSAGLRRLNEAAAARSRTESDARA
jgi:hypothetical protein